jgi:hypothetical protein
MAANLFDEAGLISMPSGLALALLVVWRAGGKTLRGAGDERVC